ncbi:MAG: hypothetical protein RSB02_06155 [Anaerovoracaceae bacterium]
MSKDHIAIPKTTLKNFADKASGKINFLDVKTNTIHSAFAKTFNTAENYYPKDKEGYLSAEIETVMGRLDRALEALQNGAEEVLLPSSVREDVIRCLAVQQLRVPDFMHNVCSQSLFSECFPPEFFSPLHRNGSKRIEIAIAAFEKLLKSYDVNVCVIDPNDTFSFILPTSHSLTNGKNMLLVLSPYRSLILLPKSDNQKYYTTDGYLGYLQVKKYTDIEPIFLKTVASEQKLENGKIVGLKPQLEVLQKSIDT